MMGLVAAMTTNEEVRFHRSASHAGDKALCWINFYSRCKNRYALRYWSVA